MAKKKEPTEEAPATPLVEAAKTIGEAAGKVVATVTKSKKIPKLAKKDKQRMPRKAKKQQQKLQNAKKRAETKHRNA